jgi:hypothetical protein
VIGERLTAIDGAWLPEVSERWLVKKGIAIARLSRELKDKIANKLHISRKQVKWVMKKAKKPFPRRFVAIFPISPNPLKATDSGTSGRIVQGKNAIFSHGMV